MTSTTETSHPVDSIIIVRRKHDDDHGHHGGAWKIAYADFVTAMMAFFLVMWLINAANEKTKAQVASYFNPVKLTDASTSKKGINEPAKVTSDGDKSEKSAATGNLSNVKSEKPPDKNAEPTQFTADEIFKNPYGILAQLASQAGDGAPSGHAAKGLAIIENVDSGHKGGEAYRDPFDPLVWKALPDAKAKTSDTKTKPGAAVEKAAPDKVGLEKVGEGKSGEENIDAAKIAAGKIEAQKIEAQKIASKLVINGEAPSPETPDKKAANVVVDRLGKVHEGEAFQPLPPAAASANNAAGEPDKAARDASPAAASEVVKFEASSAKTAIAVRRQLADELKQFDPEKNPVLDVKQTEEGVLISLTDSLNFDMFAIGSAEPKPQLVVLMEKLANTLRTYKGKIVIRGHTDLRRFRNPDYDNWRLSTARAQMAYYMLVRAGVDEKSVERIEGYADRNLKRPDQPDAAENRRIEILLKVNQP